MTNWLVQLSNTTGRQSLGLVHVSPPLCRSRTLPCISATVIGSARSLSVVRIEFTHLHIIVSSASVRVFIISACVPSSPVAFPFFRKFCMKARQAFSVISPLSQSGWSSGMVGSKALACCRKSMHPTVPLPSLKDISFQHLGQNPWRYV